MQWDKVAGDIAIKDNGYQYSNSFPYFSEYVIECFDKLTKPIPVSIQVKFLLPRFDNGVN